MGRRRTGRELALQMAFQIDLGGLDPRHIEHHLGYLPVMDDEDVFAPEPPPEGTVEVAEIPAPELSDADWERAKSFAADLVRGMQASRAELDEIIARQVENWRPERLTAVDHVILRLAIHELLHSPDVPPKAAMNEWIEVAKKYSTASSGAFVNGILDRVFRRLPARHLDLEKGSH